LNEKGVKKLNNGLVTGITMGGGDLTPCVSCFEGEQGRITFHYLKGSRPGELLETVHSDVCGPFSPYLGGNKYILTLIDDQSRNSKSPKAYPVPRLLLYKVGLELY